MIKKTCRTEVDVPKDDLENWLRAAAGIPMKDRDFGSLFTSTVFQIILKDGSVVQWENVMSVKVKYASDKEADPPSVVAHRENGSQKR